MNRMESGEHLEVELLKQFREHNRLGYNHVIFVLSASRDWLYSYPQYLEVYVPRILKPKMSNKCTRATCIRASNFIAKILFNDKGTGAFIAISC